jgi:hypothetical protein
MIPCSKIGKFSKTLEKIQKWPQLQLNTSSRDAISTILCVLEFFKNNLGNFEIAKKKSTFPFP